MKLVCLSVFAVLFAGSALAETGAQPAAAQVLPMGLSCGGPGPAVYKGRIDGSYSTGPSLECVRPGATPTLSYGSWGSVNVTPAQMAAAGRVPEGVSCGGPGPTVYINPLSGARVPSPSTECRAEVGAAPREIDVIAPPNATFALGLIEIGRSQ